MDQTQFRNPGASKNRNNLKYWDRQAFAKSVDPNQTPQYAESDQSLHCLPYIKLYFTRIKR